MHRYWWNSAKAPCRSYRVLFPKFALSRPLDLDNVRKASAADART